MYRRTLERGETTVTKVTVILFVTGAIIETRVAIAFASATNSNTIKTDQSGGSHIHMATVDHETTHAANETITVVNRGAYN